MYKSESLFILIKSLTRTEKGYFKKLALRNSAKKSNIYIELFDAIDNQENYDKNSIAVHKRYINLLPQYKQYLYKQILKSLEQYYHSQSPRTLLKNILNQVEILYNKTLYKQCLNLLVKAKKIAYDHERYRSALQICAWQRVIYAKVETIFAIAEEKNKQLIKEERQILDVLINLNDFQSAYRDIKIYTAEMDKARSTKQSKEIDRIFSHSVFKSEDNAKSFFAKSIYYGAYSDYHYRKGNLKKSAFFAKKVIELIQSEPKKSNRFFDQMILYLNNLLTILLQIKEYDDFILNLEILKNLKTKNPKTQLRILATSIILELQLYTQSGRYQAGLDIINKRCNSNDLFNNKLDPLEQIGLNYYISYTYFISTNYFRAKEWINIILNYSHLELRGDFYYFARLMDLIICFELEEFELLEYKVKSVYRFFYKKERLYKFETALIDFIRTTLSTINVLDKNSLKDAFKLLKNNLEKIAKNPYEQKALDLFDFTAWLESKIKDKSFASIIKERAATA